MEKNIAKNSSRKSHDSKAKKPSEKPAFQSKTMELKARINRLSELCNELNPYGEITPEQKTLLASYNILDVSDPFKITNQLLVLLEDSIDELHLLEPLSDEEKKQEIF